MNKEPVPQARKNLDDWAAIGNRFGESVHWRQMNPHISAISDLSQFRRINAENAMTKSGVGRLGLDSARLDQDSETQGVFDLLLSRWDFSDIAGLLESEVGCPPQYEVRGPEDSILRTDVHDLHMVNFALTFCRYTSNSWAVPVTIVEIGGGYGATVAKIAMRLPKARFVLVDLPPAGWLQSYYLNSLFPGEVKVIPLNSHLESADLTHRFTICEPGTFLRGAISISGVINARSFGEMEKSVVRHYFEYIQKNLVPDGLFMNVNRHGKLGFRFVDYPYDDKWLVIRSAPAFNQEWNHWELVARRTTKPEVKFQSWRDEVPSPERESWARNLYLRFAKLRHR